MHELLFGLEPLVRIQQFFGYGHEMVFEAFSLLGDTWGILMVMAIAMWGYGRETTYGVFAAIVASVLIKEAFNIFVEIPRPSGGELVLYENLKTPSFPSGHVLTAVAAWGFLAARNRMPTYVPWVVALLVCFGRLYLGSHFLVDVLVGAVAGGAIAWGFPYLWDRLQPRLADLSYTHFLIAGTLAVAVVAVNLALSADIPHRWGVTGAGIGLISGMLMQWKAADHSGKAAGWRPFVTAFFLLILIGMPLRFTDILLVNLFAAFAGALWAMLATSLVLTPTD